MHTRLNMMGSEHEHAATIIQKRARGIFARREARKKKLQQESERTPHAEYDEADMKRIVKLQALARAKKERAKLQRKVSCMRVVYVCADQGMRRISR